MRRRLLKPLRLGVALIFLAGLTAAFADFRGLVPARVAHWLAAVQFTPALLAAGASLAGLAVVTGLALVTLLFGRIYCSTVCPLGLMQDAIARVRAWVRPRRRPLPFAREHRWLRYGLLAAVVLTIAGGAGAVGYSYADPYSNFGRIVSGLFRPVLVAGNNLLVGGLGSWSGAWLYRVQPAWPGLGILIPAGVVLVLVVGLAAWRERIYCNTLCPVGSVLGLLARGGVFRLAIDRSACRKCAQCLGACKAQCIDLRSGTIDASRCVACFNCVSACDDHGIGYRFAWRPEPKPTPPARDRTAPSGPDHARRAFIAGGLLLAPATLLRAADASAPAGEPRTPVSPPGSGGVACFLDRCTACQLCVSACPTQVLRPAFLEYGIAGLAKPHLDFERAFCNFDCQRCGEVCPDGAIVPLALADKRLTSLGVAKFERARCIVETDGTDCAACSEHCPTKAVETAPYGGHLRLPRVDESLCIGCGACEHACPVRPQRAIRVEARREHTRARQAVEAPPPKPAAGDFPF